MPIVPAAHFLSAIVLATTSSLSDELLDKLAAATNEQEAGVIEEEVWQAWLISGSATVDILMTRGMDALEQNDLDLARDMFDRAVLVRPQYAEAWYRRALLFFNDGKYDQAIADLEATLAREPRHFGAWIGLGMIFESIEQPAAALKSYREALKHHPNAVAAKRGEERLTPQVDGRAF
ncbi:tetratricopeptide repeat protein [bacterium]|nr:tetratricopeptide repeat protein [bacterium]